LNVVSGERSNLGRSEAMYVLDPHEQTVVRGWRTSLHDVRKFVFVDEERSYAERTGQANGALGWIRVLAFRQRGPFGDGKVREGRRNDDRGGEPFSGRVEGGRDMAPEGHTEGNTLQPAPESNSNPGTGWGERSWDPVNRTWFNPEAYATDQI